MDKLPAIEQLRNRLVAGIKIANRKSLFYDRSNGVLQAGGLVGVIAGTLPGVFAIIAWGKGREIPRSLAWVILSAYLVNMLTVTIGTQVAFAWLDYGLARMGISRPTRSALWVGISAAVPISAFAIYAELSLVAGLMTVFTGSLVVAGLYWTVSILRIGAEAAPESPATVAQDLTSYVVTNGLGLGGPIKGAYRLTLEEFLRAVGYSIMSQPRFYGKPWPISALLPRSVDHRSVEAIFSGHPHRDRIVRFSADANSITWQVENLTERTVSWEQVKEVIRTPKGFLLCWTRRNFDWIPFHAFFTRDGSDAFVELAKRHTEYAEIT